jgi:hypothetical protein
MAHLLMPRYSPAASTQKQAKITNALLMFPPGLSLPQHMVPSCRLSGFQAQITRLNFGKPQDDGVTKFL